MLLVCVCVSLMASGKESGDAGDGGSLPGLGRSSGEGNGNLLQYSCLENSMDRGAWQATVHRVAKTQTRLSNSAPTHTVIVIFPLQLKQRVGWWLEGVEEMGRCWSNAHASSYEMSEFWGPNIQDGDCG